MNEIGELLKSTRESAGISLEEASSDLEIKTLILENIEDGNIGCFKDIFVLKEYLSNYAKYLGLDEKKIIDEFNDYLFEYTSKIPVEDIEKAMKEQQKSTTEEEKDKIISPYTVNTKEEKNPLVTILLIVLAVLVFVVGLWSIKQITVDHRATNRISYENR